MKYKIIHEVNSRGEDWWLARDENDVYVPYTNTMEGVKACEALLRRAVVKAFDVVKEVEL